MKIRVLALLCALLLSFHSCKTEPPKPVIAENTEVRQWKPEDTRSVTGLMAKRGLISRTAEATPGYVLLVPSESKRTYLLDMDGAVVHSWEGKLNSMNVYLRKNGNLVRLERDENFPTFAAGGQSGRISEYDWEGNQVWGFKWADDKQLIHHDIELMPNGNILAISYETKTPEEALAAGRDPKHIPKAGLWPDKIIEIKPTKPEGGEIVWEWHMWDHLIQDLDPKKANYGVIADNPGKININAGVDAEAGGPPVTQEQINEQIKIGAATSNATVENRGSDITHTNAIGYNEALDQIVISVPGFNEIMIIDHSTTTEEARGSTGGKAGHGGELLYRWGNAVNYGRGESKDQQLFGQHDVKWIPEGYPGAGHLMVFNNDIKSSANKLPSMFAAFATANSPDPQISIGDFGNYSAVYEIQTPAGDGAYTLEDQAAFGPKEPTWSYTAPDKYSFYSAFISGAHRMKNGHTFITSGASGRLFEVTPDNEIVWEYWNPYNEHYRLPDGTRAQPVGPFMYNQFRATHLPTDHEAFSGKDLKPISPQPEPFIFKMPPAPKEKDSVR